MIVGLSLVSGCAGLLLCALFWQPSSPLSPSPQGVAKKARNRPVLFWTAQPTICPRELMPVAANINTEESAGTAAFRSNMTPSCHRKTAHDVVEQLCPTIWPLSLMAPASAVTSPGSVPRSVATPSCQKNARLTAVTGSG